MVGPSSLVSVTARYPWREFWAFVGLGLVGVLLVLPYQLALLPSPPIPLPLLVAGALAQSAILIAIAVVVGLAAARRVGLRAPLVEAWLYGGDTRNALRGLRLPLALALGVGSAGAVVVLGFALFRPLIPELSRLGAASPERWQGFLASFYGAITEELLTRLFLVSVLAWLLTRAVRGPLAFWLAITLAAALFGLGHLPATAALVPLTPGLIVRAVILNGIPGVAFGWLYWQRGLEAAMVAHFSADLVLHVIVGG